MGRIERAGSHAPPPDLSDPLHVLGSRLPVLDPADLSLSLTHTHTLSLSVSPSRSLHALSLSISLFAHLSTDTQPKLNTQLPIFPTILHSLRKSPLSPPQAAKLPCDLDSMLSHYLDLYLSSLSLSSLPVPRLVKLLDLSLLLLHSFSRGLSRGRISKQRGGGAGTGRDGRNDWPGAVQFIEGGWGRLSGESAGRGRGRRTAWRGRRTQGGTGATLGQGAVQLIGGGWGRGGAPLGEGGVLGLEALHLLPHQLLPRLKLPLPRPAAADACELSPQGPPAAAWSERQAGHGAFRQWNPCIMSG